MQFLEHILKSIGSLVLPSACIACQSVQSESICQSRLQTLETTSLKHYECCNQCGVPLKQNEVHDQQCTNCIVHRANDQAKKLLLARQDAVHGLFYIDSKFQERLMGKTIIVFDDVMTSGATLNEIARTLKSIEVLRVVNWVLLRTTRPV